MLRGRLNGRLPIALDMARTPRTRGTSQYITRPPAAWIRSSSSGRSGCTQKQKKVSKCQDINLYASNGWA